MGARWRWHLLAALTAWAALAVAEAAFVAALAAAAGFAVWQGLFQGSARLASSTAGALALLTMTITALAAAGPTVAGAALVVASFAVPVVATIGAITQGQPRASAVATGLAVSMTWLAVTLPAVALAALASRSVAVTVVFVASLLAFQAGAAVAGDGPRAPWHQSLVGAVGAAAVGFLVSALYIPPFNPQQAALVTVLAATGPVVSRAIASDVGLASHGRHGQVQPGRGAMRPIGFSAPLQWIPLATLSAPTWLWLEGVLG